MKTFESFLAFINTPTNEVVHLDHSHGLNQCAVGKFTAQYDEDLLPSDVFDSMMNQVIKELTTVFPKRVFNINWTHLFSVLEQENYYVQVVQLLQDINDIDTMVEHAQTIDDLVYYIKKKYPLLRAV